MVQQMLCIGTTRVAAHDYSKIPPSSFSDKHEKTLPLKLTLQPPVFSKICMYFKSFECQCRILIDSSNDCYQKFKEIFPKKIINHHSWMFGCSIYQIGRRTKYVCTNSYVDFSLQDHIHGLLSNQMMLEVSIIYSCGIQHQDNMKQN